MGRAKHCTICTSDPVISSQVNSLIEAGVRQKVISTEFPQFSVSKLSRHTRVCLQPTLAPDLSTDVGAGEMQVWRDRCEAAYHLAIANGDSKAAIQACSAATRQLAALAKHQEAEARKAEKAIHDPTDVQFTVTQIDALIKHDAESGVGNSSYPRVYTLCNEEQLFRQLVDAIWANRLLLPMLLAAATTNYIPERKSENVQPNN
jgi:hypothetical protein